MEGKNIKFVKGLIIKRLEERPSNKNLILNEVYNEIQGKDIFEDEVATALEKLKKEGIIQIYNSGFLFWQQVIKKI